MRLLCCRRTRARCGRARWWECGDRSTGEALQARNAGLRRPTTAWALDWYDGTLYGSDYAGVYRWGGGRWRHSSGQFGVVMLDDEGKAGLAASSMGDGISVLRGRAWTVSDARLVAHHHVPGGFAGVHVVSVTMGRGGGHTPARCSQVWP